MFNSQAGQDVFTNLATQNKSNGWFIEIGSNHYNYHNNTYFFETNLNWKGIMIEYDNSFLNDYKKYRKNSIHIINDATKINYLELLKTSNFPNIIDYLQIDLDVDNRSTLTTLEIFDKEIFDKYKFGVITFEHDIYRGNYFNTREISRKIFDKHGYKLVYPDVEYISDNKYQPFEDWYIHPDLIDSTKLKESIKYSCKYNCNCKSNAVKIK